MDEHTKLLDKIRRIEALHAGAGSRKSVRNRFFTRVLSVDSLCAMGRPRRADDGGLIYHVLNRANARMTIFENDGDYDALERVLEEAVDRLIAREQGCWPTVSCPTTGT